MWPFAKYTDPFAVYQKTGRPNELPPPEIPPQREVDLILLTRRGWRSWITAVHAITSLAVHVIRLQDRIDALEQKKEK